MAKDKTKEKGVSLAKGPVALVGLLALIYGVTALLFGDNSLTSDPLSGTVNGEKWLGLEVNGWSSLLFIAGGALLLFGAPLHWGAKALSLIVGLAFGAASVIAIVDGNDVFGIFAANGLTELVWGVAAAVLLILALLPRVGANKKHDDADREPVRSPGRVEREPVQTRRVEYEPTLPARASSDPRGDERVVAPASGTTAESRDTTRRQRRGDI